MNEENSNLVQKTISPLEYRPNLDVSSSKVIGGFLKSDTEIEEYIPSASDDKEVGTGLLTDEIENFKDIQKTINQTIDNLRLELKDLVVLPEDSFYLKSLNESKESLGLQGNGQISIGDYEYALNHINNPSGAYIVELWEEVQESEQGNLKAELFGDLVELSIEYSHLEKYIQRFINKALFDVALDMNEEGWEQTLLKAEQTQKKLMDELKERETIAKKDLMEASLFNSDGILSAKDNAYQIRGYKTQVMNTDLSIRNAYQTIQMKNMETEIIVSEIVSNLDRKTFNDKSNLLLPLSSITKTKEDMQKALTSSTVMLKLAVDSENNKKNTIKNELRNTYSVSNRDVLLDDYELDERLFNQFVADLEHRFSFFNGNQNSDTTLYLNKVTKGMAELYELKETRAQEYFSLNQEAANLRRAKIENVFDKDDARQSFHFSNELFELVDEKGKPTAATYKNYLS